MARILATTLLVLVCAGLTVGLDNSRRLLQTPVSSPNFAPAPTVSVNGVTGYTCPSPGSTGYLFQPAPCAYGPNAGSPIYCDEAAGGRTGYVGIRNTNGARCTATSDCRSGEFCNAHYSPGRCNAVATSACFAGAPAPAPTRA